MGCDADSVTTLSQLMEERLLHGIGDKVSAQMVGRVTCC